MYLGINNNKSMRNKSTRERQIIRRIKLLESVRSPFSLFTLITIIADMGLMGGMCFAPAQIKHIMLWSAIGIVSLVMIIVAILAAWRPSNLYFSEQSLAHSLGVDIYQAVAMNISKLKDDEKLEVFKRIIQLIQEAHDPQHRSVRNAIAEVIQHRISKN